MSERNAITVNAELDINPLPLKPRKWEYQMMLDGLSCMIDITSLTANYNDREMVILTTLMEKVQNNIHIPIRTKVFIKWKL